MAHDQNDLKLFSINNYRAKNKIIIENLIIKKRKLVRCRDQPNNSRDTMHNMTLI